MCREQLPLLESILRQWSTGGLETPDALTTVRLAAGHIIFFFSASASAWALDFRPHPLELASTWDRKLIQLLADNVYLFVAIL